MKECMEPSGASPRPLSVRKKWLYGGIAAVLSCALIVASLEIVLSLLLANRVAAEADTPLVQSQIPGLNYELISNHNVGSVRTGPNGLRPRKASDPATDFRVLLVGDSIAYGMGVTYDDSLAPQLEREIERLAGRSTAVWNAAVPGYNTTQERLRMQQIAPIVRPNLIIVQFCMNDYEGSARLASDGILEVTSDSGPASFSLAGSLAGLINHSRTLQWAKGQIRNLQQARPEWFPVWAHYVHRVAGKPGWTIAKETLRTMKQQAIAMDASLMVVVFPVEQQLRIGDRSAQDDLIAFAKSHAIPLVDLYPSFLAHWKEGLYIDYWEKTGTVDKLHPNARGHRLAAAEVAKYLAGNPPFAGVQ
jgi:lysophospholipase L1-like esterase